MILGITGSFGAGKGAVVDYLVAEKGFSHFSASGFITEEIVRRGMPINRDSMITVANDLRIQHGPSYIIDSLYRTAEAVGGNAVIESLRAIAEVKRIKELGGTVLGVDAKPELRYTRAFARGSEKDAVPYEKWLEQEKMESNPNDPTKQDIFGALRTSDYFIENNGPMEELHTKIETIVSQITAS